jgi:hypothetical protein
MEAITTLYYNAAATAALRMDRLAERGAEKGAMTSTEIAGWTVAVLVIVGIAVTALKVAVTKRIDVITNAPVSQ